MNAGSHRLATRLAVPLFVLLAMAAGSAVPLRAQVLDPARVPPLPADTLRPPPDSLFIPAPLLAVPDTTGRYSLRSDSLRTGAARRGGPAPLQAPPLGFDRRAPGAVVVPARPAQTPALNAADLLAEAPGSFLYDLGAIGWPHGWSEEGLRPAFAGLRLEGRPLADPLTGRPRYDLLPLMLLRPLRMGGTQALGRPNAVVAQIRPYDSPRPLTELRYHASTAAGMQAITALHTQRRLRALFGRQGALDVLGAYEGRAADNTFPGSRLSTERRLLGRLRYAQEHWAAEVSALHNRRRLGAHGGVQPRGALATVFNTINPTVRNPNAERRIIRTDLAATGRVRWRSAPVDPLTASAYWTAQFFRYRPERDSAFVARTDRYGAFAEQTVTTPRHRLRLRLDGWIDRLGEGNAVPDSAFTGRLRWHASARDSLALGGFGVMAEAGLHGGGPSSYLSGRLGLTRALGPVRLFAEGQRTGLDPSLVEEYGFGPFVRPLAEAEVGMLQEGRFGIGLEAGPLDARLEGFAHEISDAPDLYVLAAPGADTLLAPPADSAAALRTDEPLRRVGATAALGLRRHARLGLYLTAQATTQRLLDADASPLAARQAAAVPEVYGRARLGARLSLFTGDLDLDLYAQGRFWTAMRSRALHAPTGLLALPLPSTATTGPTGVLDLYAEARIRTATLFFAYENALSGTQVQRGVFVAPIYPLAEQRFRFGVFWPIYN